MALAPRQLNRATLARQLLLRREPVQVDEGVHRVVAIQAQEPASPYLALWNRLADLHPTDVDRAFATRSVVKATLMRITLHAVHRDDYPSFHAAMLPNLRASRLGDPRFTSSGLTIDDVDALTEKVVHFTTEPRTRQEIEAMLADELGVDPEPGVWWALKTFSPLQHHPVDATWSFDRVPRFFAASPGPSDDVDAGLQHLIRRYLEGFGPAAAEDIAQFALQKRRVVRAALGSMQAELHIFDGPDGRPLYDLPDRPLPDVDTPAPARLLGMWDSVLLAYDRRDRIIPDEYRPTVIRRNGDVLPTLLVDGYVAGVWRNEGEQVVAHAFHPLPEHTWEGLHEEARRLRTFLADREPTPYARYDRWWQQLPEGQTRELTA